jgi:hypothetical protein
MTTTRFGAPAPNTRARYYSRPAYASAGALGFRLIRLVWLTARFARREFVTIDDYRRRFGMSLRSFHRDVGILRQAGFEIEPVMKRTYRMVCFTFDSDCA